ncbi:uncharacterized protein LOC122293021 [Carya illinoinensis]|uniref:Uncharacterized protein n=1 Tax=Carya illinoinensis TaxID=32201 RepID=A0A8T1NLC5_CARIL|nr:uncharacterized protein LOC122293021 [Carya illinoinensis]KAG6630492.1 hypothetical protein CIPAW_13G021700 [Carya illinoinensis]
MRCNKHTSDLSCTVGVCASCLRDRLIALIAAQSQAQAQAQAQHHQLSRSQSRAAAVPDDPRKSDPNLPPPPLVFPRSVSPYVSRRKSDDSTWQHQHPDSQDRRFYSTPQVGPTYAATTFANVGSYRKKNGRFSLFSKLFRSRSEKLEPDPRVLSRHPCEPSSSTSSSTPSWFTTIFSGNRKKQSRLFFLDESVANVDKNNFRRADRGMSPARTADSDEDYDRSASASGYCSESWRSPAFAMRRNRQGQGRNVSGIAFCLSPLVRASPGRHWNQKCMPPDAAVSGEMRTAGKPYLTTAASFCKNRSRKLADFGRVGHNR